jgi:ribonuclease HI
MPEFQCQTCLKAFEVSQAALDKYPGWKPKVCIRCREAATSKGSTKSKAPSSAGSSGHSKRSASRAGSAAGSSSAEQNLSVKEVLLRYSDGPDSGVFTDGAASPNPGPGGWGAVYVRGGEIVAEAYGNEPHTTNNRMELMALIAGFDLVPSDEAVDVWSDSQLCVNTINSWAAQWEKLGWKRKSGEIKNLELVQQLYSLAKKKPQVRLRWIKAHSGLRWNEYADALATAYRRSEK